LAHPATGHGTVAALRDYDGMGALHISHVAHPDLRFATPSGKVEFYSQRAKELGMPLLPMYASAPEAAQPLILAQGRTLTPNYLTKLYRLLVESVASIFVNGSGYRADFPLRRALELVLFFAPEMATFM